MKKIILLALMWLVASPLFISSSYSTLTLPNVEVKVSSLFDQENLLLENVSSLNYGSTINFSSGEIPEDYNFLYWIVNGVVRYDLNYNHDFVVTSALDLIAVYHPTNPLKYVVNFLDSNGQIISTQYVNPNGDALEPIELPDKPGLTYANNKWKTQSGLNATLSDIQEHSIFILQYVTSSADTFLITSTNGFGGGIYNYNQLVTVFATAELNDELFSHWLEDGVIVSRNINYTFTAVSNRTLVAVYQGTPETDEPLIILSKDLKVRNGFNTYIGQFYLPEGYQIIEYGFLIHEDNTLDLELTTPGANIAINNKFNEFSHEFVMSFPIGSHLNVKAYVVYAFNNQLFSVYSENNLLYTVKYVVVAQDENVHAIPLGLEETVTSVSLGEHHSSALTSEGRLFMWGGNQYGELGIGTDVDIFAPLNINSYFALSEGEVIVSASLGEHHSSALTSLGRVFTWGSNLRYQLGDGTNTNRNTPFDITSRFDLNEGEKVISLSMGLTHSSALTSDGRLFMWGMNFSGQLGIGITGSTVAIPTDITANFNLLEEEVIVSVSLARNQSSALTSIGRVFVWGRNDQGQLGDGTTADKNIPTDISSHFTLSIDEKIVMISLGENYAAALTSLGRVFTWGTNDFGQLGDGSTIGKNTPIEITGYFDLGGSDQVIFISLGGGSSAAITKEGEVFVWGNNNSGLLGANLTFGGGMGNKETPINITAELNRIGASNVISLSFGNYYHSAVLTETSGIFTAGENNYGHLGDGTGKTKSIQVEITSGFNLNEGETIDLASTGEYHSAALTSLGRLFMWGSNGSTQIGDGTSNDVLFPTEITSQFTLGEEELIVSVSLGANHSSALTSLGRVFTWGYNNFGQLGNGNTLSQNTPTEITSQFILSEGEKIISLSMGGNHSSALTSLGRVFTWGYNSFGQLGNGDTLNQNTPIEITSNFEFNEGEAITLVSFGDFHSAILTSEGRVFMWGRNNQGQLGDNTLENRHTPLDITSQFTLGITEVITLISLGSTHTAALTSLGNLFTWGDNEYGQLGDGTTVNSNTPISIIHKFSLTGNDQILYISLDGYSSSAITSNAQVFFWGSNEGGQIGANLSFENASMSYIEEPTNITGHLSLLGINNVSSISLGYYDFSLILTADNKVFTAGNNDSGQLGDGTGLRKSNHVYVPFIVPTSSLTSIYAFNEDINEYVPTLAGFQFSGWYSDVNLINPYIFGSMPEANVILYGAWTINTYTITFNSNGGSEVMSIVKDYDTVITEPTMPTKEEHIFGGWYTDEALTTPFDFDKMPAEDIYLFALWTINQYTIEYAIYSNEYDALSSILLQSEETIISVSASGEHTAALTSKGRLFTWGNNFDGQLGDGTKINKSNPTDITQKFNLGANEIITVIELGDFHSAALTSEGRVFTWGRGWRGQLGDAVAADRLNPTDITSFFNLNLGESIIALSLGAQHSSALSSDGRMFVWGDNDFGQLGNGTTLTQTQPINITTHFGLASGETITAISMGREHSSALTSEGRMFVWGDNSSGQIGDNSYVQRNLPTDITSHFNLTAEEQILMISVGQYHSGALTSTGRMFVWGANGYGEIGDGTNMFRATPTDITSHFNLSGEDYISYISLGGGSSAAITVESQFFVWGANGGGQLGDGTTTNRSAPINTTSDYSFVGAGHLESASFSNGHLIVLSSTRRIFTVGENYNGQLGDGRLFPNDDDEDEVFEDEAYSIPAEDMRLTPFKIPFITPTLVLTMTYDFNATITEHVPSLADHMFIGWFTEKEMINMYVFGNMPSYDLILYGYWQMDA